MKQEYIHTNIGQRALAERYGVTPRQVAYRAKRDGWFAEKQKHLSEYRKEDAPNQEGGSVEISLLADKLCQKTNIAIDSLDGKVCNTQQLRQLVQSVKDLKEIIRSGDGASDTGQLESLVKGLCDV